MRVGLFPPISNPLATPEHVAALGQAAEERGFASLWLPEHVVLFDDPDSRYPYSSSGRFPAGPDRGLLEPLAALAFLAGATSRIRLGTGVLLLPQRNPVYSAKTATTVDWLSRGRLDLGIGVGWQAEEYAAVDVPFERRGLRCREYVEVMRTLWCDEVSAYDGELYTLPPCRQFPKPVQRPHPPLHIGGESDAALRRVARFGQGWYGFGLDPGGAAEGIDRLTRMLAEAGRSRDEILVSVCPYTRPVTRDDVLRYADAGVDQLIGYVLVRSTDTIEQQLDETMELYAVG